MRWGKRFLPALIWGVPLLLLLPPGELLLLGSAVILHEAGHLLGFAVLGEPPPSLFAVAAGLTLRARRPLAYGREAVICLAGPLANLLLALPLLLSPGVGANGKLTGAVHLMTAVTNLVPLGASDGGRALRALLSCLLPLGAVDAITGGVALLSGAVILLFSLFLLHSNGGSGGVILLVWLLVRATAERRN